MDRASETVGAVPWVSPAFACAEAMRPSAMPMITTIPCAADLGQKTTRPNRACIFVVNTGTLPHRQPDGPLS